MENGTITEKAIKLDIAYKIKEIAEAKKSEIEDISINAILGRVKNSILEDLNEYIQAPEILDGALSLRKTHGGCPEHWICIDFPNGRRLDIGLWNDYTRGLHYIEPTPGAMY